MNDAGDAVNERKAGLLASLRTLVTTLVAIAGNRLEILITEVQQEKIRLSRILIFGSAMLFFVAMALVFLSLLILVAFWNEYRLAALGGITGVYILLAILAGWRMRRNVQHKSRLFVTSLGELRKDHRELDTENP
jgi:uncharacterized membrane protein YqjE